ncbi:MAG: YihA family ribosome biogenesis GTP-binding protein [Selenomonadaceae bacterium]|nr:YihA family ribosome biogenesis GTP-binding protein [Selenomonadaceae bacterium]MBP3723422.1 YihA family ribosome biogenesis GTP-binding protein [Selenomonadaceae bacterium]
MKEDIIVISAKYILSAVNHSQYPENELPEIAFWGRSNVGKSSLINSLVRIKNLARVSSQPGKTQTINFYEVDLKAEGERKAFYLADLPGYGYAKTGKDARKTWAKFIAEYLTTSKNLLFLCLLVDLRHDPQANDRETFDFLLKNNIPTLIIGTKSDKISKNAVQKSVKNIKEVFGEEDLSVLPYSSVKNEGRAELLTTIKNSLFEVQ